MTKYSSGSWPSFRGRAAVWANTLLVARNERGTSRWTVLPSGDILTSCREPFQNIRWAGIALSTSRKNVRPARHATLNHVIPDQSFVLEQ
jgi:hypothetical protein